MQKNVAFARYSSRMSSTRGVVVGAGPSSRETRATPRAAASVGSLAQFGPRSLLRGQSPAAVMVAWFAATSPSDQCHKCGCAAVAATALTCNAVDALQSIVLD